MNDLYLAELIMRRLIFGFVTVTYRSYRFFDFIFVVIDLMARFYRHSFNSDRNVSDKLSQDSSLKSPKLFFNSGKRVIVSQVNYISCCQVEHFSNLYTPTNAPPSSGINLLYIAKASLYLGLKQCILVYFKDAYFHIKLYFYIIRCIF